MAGDAEDRSSAGRSRCQLEIALLSAFLVLLALDFLFRKWRTLEELFNMHKCLIMSICTARTASVAGMLCFVFLICAFKIPRRFATLGFVSLSFQIFGLEAEHLSQSLAVMHFGTLVPWKMQRIVWGIKIQEEDVGRRVGWLAISTSVICTTVSMTVGIVSMCIAIRPWQGDLLIAVNVLAECVNTTAGVAVFYPRTFGCENHNLNPSAQCRRCWSKAIRRNPSVFIVPVMRLLTIVPFAVWAAEHFKPAGPRYRGCLSSTLCEAVHVVLRTLLTEGGGSVVRVFDWMKRRKGKQQEKLNRLPSQVEDQEALRKASICSEGFDGAISITEEGH